MIHVNLTDMQIKRPHVLTWPTNRRVRGKVRVVYREPEELRAVLADLCADDSGPIEVLDIETPRWGFVFYDNSRVRAALGRVGGAPVKPEVLWLSSRNSALWLIERLTTEEQCKSNP